MKKAQKFSNTIKKNVENRHLLAFCESFSFKALVKLESEIQTGIYERALRPNMNPVR